MDTKDKLIDLFLKVIADKDFEIEDTTGQIVHSFSENSNTCYFSSSGGYAESSVIFTEKDGKGLLHSTKRNYKYDFDANMVGLSRRYAKIVFDSWPGLKINCSTSMVEHDTRTITIRRKGLLRFIKKKIIKHMYKRAVKPENVYIEFGPLKFEIAESEFNMMFDAIANELEKRRHKEAYGKLDQRLSKYDK